MAKPLQGYGDFEELCVATEHRYLRARGHDGRSVLVKEPHHARDMTVLRNRLAHEFAILRLLRGSQAALEPLALHLGEDDADPYIGAIFGGFAGVRLDAVLRVQRMPVQPFLEVAMALAQAVHRIHALGVTHHNIAPTTIMLDPETRQVRLIDFDVASRAAHEEYEAVANSRLEGKLAYISPEQTGRAQRGVDWRSDIYSLGVTLYEMLTGLPPFVSDDPQELIRCHLVKPAAPLTEAQAGIDETLSAIILKCLAKSPDERYQSARGVMVDLETYQRWTAQNKSPREIKLGTDDVPPRLKSSHRLYGREEQVGTIAEVLLRAGSTAGVEMVVLNGPPGIGKTALVQRSIRPLVRRTAFFAGVRLGRYQPLTPHRGVLALCQDLVNTILQLDLDERARWTKELRQALGTQFQPLVARVPALQELAPHEAPPQGEPFADAMDARNRLRGALQCFFACFSRRGQPLVLFIDDAHWLDVESVPLIAALTETCPHLAIIVGTQQGLSIPPLVDALAHGTCRTTTLAIGPLSEEHVGSLLAETLHLGRAAAAPLAALLSRATGGNPLHLTLLLESLVHDRLLHYDAGTGAWRWDMTHLQAVAQPHELTTLVGALLGAMPPKCRALLKTSVCVGNEFDLRLVANASGISLAAAASELEPAIALGVIRPVGEASRLLRDGATDDLLDRPIEFRFAHDELSQTVMALFELPTRPSAHIDIVNALTARETARHDDDIFIRAHHVEMAHTGGAAHPNAVQLLVAAGDRAYQLAAFDVAVHYLHAARELLPADAWQHAHDLAMSTASRLAECYFAVGEPQAAQALFAEAHEHAGTRDEHAALFHPQILFFLGNGMDREAAATARAALALFGLRIPERPRWWDVGLAFVRVSLALLYMRLVGARSVGDIIARVGATRGEQRIAALLLAYLGFAADHLNDTRLYAYISFAGLRHGLRAKSAELIALGCIGYGIALMSGLRSYKSAAQLNDAGSLFDPEGGTTDAVMVLANALLFTHWRAPARNAAEQMQAVRLAKLQTGGGLMWGAHAAFMEGLVRLHIGEPLPQVAQHIRRASPYYGGSGRGALELYEAHLRTLGGDLSQAVELPQDSASSKPRRLTAGDATPDAVFDIFARLVQMQQAYLFGDFTRAFELGLGNDMLRFRGMLVYVDHVFYHALAAARVIRHGGARRREAHKRLKAYRSLFVRWSAVQTTNYLHKRELLEAELAALAGSFGVALRLYDASINHARLNGFVQDAAIACECAAAFLLGQGKGRHARPYVDEARHLLRQWGAVAVATRLAETYAELLFRDSGPRDEQAVAQHATLVLPSRAAEANESFDASAIAEACQTISGEIVLRDLLLNIVRLATEITQAPRAVIYLSRPDGWRVAAIADAVSHEVVALDAVNTSASKQDLRFPDRLVPDVARTMSIVMISDIPGRPSSTAATSVVGLPVMHAGAVLAVLCLEHRGKYSAFGGPRLEGLRLVLGQAGVALHNARAYSELQSLVMATSADIRRAETRLATLGRAEAERQLADNFAHEICNVLGSSKMYLDACVDVDGKTHAESISNQTAEALEALYNAAKSSLQPTQRAAVVADMRRMIDTELRLHEMLQLVSRANNRALAVTQQIVEFSRLGQQVHGMTRVNLSRLLRQLVDEARVEFMDIGIIIDTEIQDDVDVLSTEAHCYSVLRNLLQNSRDALKDVQERQRRIIVRCARVNDKVSVQVADNGTGIPATIRDKIFDAFFSTKPKTGTGLGLSMVKRIVQLYGGRIDVSSEPNIETAFTIILPGADANA